MTEFDNRIASARRLAHHVTHGGSLKPRDTDYMMILIEDMQKRIVELSEVNIDKCQQNDE